ncbi:MAG TPA: hypothetical protein VLI90_03755, partial [Tepidisphaeraceae bacterium]|nr:hypothetical protein [Tepidisphaeraceae bacterium]
AEALVFYLFERTGASAPGYYAALMAVWSSAGVPRRRPDIAHLRVASSAAAWSTLLAVASSGGVE